MMELLCSRGIKIIIYPQSPKFNTHILDGRLHLPHAVGEEVTCASCPLEMLCIECTEPNKEECCSILSVLHPISVHVQHHILKNFEYHVTTGWATDSLQDLLPFLSFMSPIVS